MGKRYLVSGGEVVLQDDVNEHLTRDLARVRAKFSMDAPPREPWLKTAWMSEVPLEEYEAEFVDTVADCLGAGMSLQDALTCWDTGDLVAEPEEEVDGASADDEPALVVAPTPPSRRPSSGHRVLVR